MLALLVATQHLPRCAAAHVVGASFGGVVPIAHQGRFRFTAIRAGEAFGQVFRPEPAGVPDFAAVVIMGKIEAADSGLPGFAPGFDGVPVGHMGAAVGIEAQVGGVALGVTVPGQQAKPAEIHAGVIAAPAFLTADELIGGEHLAQVRQQGFQGIAFTQAKRVQASQLERQGDVLSAPVFSC